VSTSTTRRLLTGLAVLCGLLAALAAAGALLATADNLHDPAYRCDSVDQNAYTACLEQAQLATPFHLHTGLWTVSLAAAIGATVATTALLAHTRSTRTA
jgi:hypothetical protein